MENIKDFIFKFLRIDNLVEHVSGYVESRVALLKIEIQEDLAQVISKGLVMGALFLFMFLCLLFLSIGVALYLNLWFANYAGFWIVGGFYLFILALLFAFRKKIHQVMSGYMARAIKNKEL